MSDSVRSYGEKTNGRVGDHVGNGISGHMGAKGRKWSEVRDESTGNNVEETRTEKQGHETQQGAKRSIVCNTTCCLQHTNDNHQHIMTEDERKYQSPMPHGSEITGNWKAAALPFFLSVSTGLASGSARVFGAEVARG